jgi:hypothetical protein
MDQQESVMNAFLRIGRLRQPRGNLVSTLLLLGTFLALGALVNVAIEHERLPTPTASQGSDAAPIESHDAVRFATYRLVYNI